MKNNWLIKGARVLDPANNFDAVRDLLIECGTIADIGMIARRSLTPAGLCWPQAS